MRRMWPGGVVLACSIASACGAPGPEAPGTKRAPPGDATTLLEAAVEAQRPRAPGTAFELRYEGALDLEGHYRRPGETRRFDASWRVASDGGALVRLEVATREGEARAEPSVETTWLAGDDVLRRDDEREAYRRLAGDEARGARALVTAALPWRGLAEARVGRRAWQLGRALWRGNQLRAAQSEEGAGRTLTLWFERDAPSLAGVERAYGHPRLGDVSDEVVYGPYVERGGLRVPATIAVREHRRDESWRGELRLRAVEAGEGAARGLAEAWREAGLRVTPGAPGAAGGVAPGAPGADGGPAPAREPPRLRELRPGVHEVVSEDVDARSLVVEFADFVAAIEAPLTSEAGERVVDAIGARFPNKPIRYVLFGHYHPHYAGGLRAFVAAGATVVAPAAGARLAAELARRPFTRSPDRLARTHVAPRVETFRGAWVLDDGANCLEAIDIGAASEHTDEYVVFYLPRAGLLFEGDLGFFARPDGGLRAGRRARGLLGAIEARGLRVERLVQSWPVRGLPAAVGFDEWKALVPGPG